MLKVKQPETKENMKPETKLIQKKNADISKTPALFN